MAQIQKHLTNSVPVESFECCVCYVDLIIIKQADLLIVTDSNRTSSVEFNCRHPVCLQCYSKLRVCPQCRSLWNPHAQASNVGIEQNQELYYQAINDSFMITGPLSRTYTTDFMSLQELLPNLQIRHYRAYLNQRTRQGHRFDLNHYYHQLRRKQNCFTDRTDLDSK